MAARLWAALWRALGHELTPFIFRPEDRLTLLGVKERVAHLEARMQELTVDHSEIIDE